MTVSFVLFLISSLLSCSLFAVTLEGIVLSEEGPVPDASVAAYQSFEALVADNPAFESKPGARPGFFEIELPSGKYYFTARGNSGKETIFSYLGANPVDVKDTSLWLPFMGTARVLPSTRDALVTQLRGVVTFRGEPVPNAQVSLYLPGDAPFRGLGLRSVTAATDGTFQIQPEPGEYVVVARKRLHSQGMRPLEKGDLFCFFPGPLLQIRASKQTRIVVPCYPKETPEVFVDPEIRGTIKRANAKLVRFRERTSPELPAAEIRGTVTDTKGKGRGDVFVMAYVLGERRLFQMHIIRDKPAFQTRTGDDGTFRLNVSRGGRYILVARSRPGGAPEPGEHFGLYEGNTNHSVYVEEGLTEGADILVSPIMSDDDPGQPSGRSMTMQDETLHNRVIGEDTTWRGSITVKGVVVVGRKATLTIEPGTVVQFDAADENNDHIGDGELRVLGKILVRGDGRSPVCFRPMKRGASSRSWSYLLLFTARARSVIEYAVFEHAFTGVQVHFSSALISDSLFRKNVEGIRFGRADVTIEHNDIVENTYGVRHHRLEDRVRIVDNNIAHNAVGLFLVPSNQNTVDFSRARYKADRRFQKQPIIVGNNIFDNERYNYKLGERFSYNVLLRDNWWGSRWLHAIEQRIFDKNDDPALGKVLVTPFLKGPALSAGKRRANR